MSTNLKPRLPSQSTEIMRLQLTVAALGMLLVVAVLVAGAIAGSPGVGPMQRRAMIGGALIFGGSFLLRLPLVARACSRIARTLALWIVTGTMLGSGLLGLELYARTRDGYVPLVRPLAKTYFVEKDRVKLYNARYVERRAYRFSPWPIPLETFEAKEPAPRYIFKPNQRMAVHGARLVPASGNDPVFWSSNAYGFRGPEFSVEKPAGIIRIVCLGGSTTEGTFNADDETYPHYLERLMNRDGTARRVEVFNAGFSGQDLDDLIAMFTTRIAPLKPDIVIFYEAHNNIDFTEFTDGLDCTIGAPVGTYWLAGYPSWVRWAARQSAVVTDLASALWRSRPITPMAHRFVPTGQKPSAVRFERNLRRLVGEVRGRQVRLVMSSFSTVAHEGLQVDPRATPGLFEDLAQKWYPLTPGELAGVYAYFNRLSARVAADCQLRYVDVAAALPRDARYFPYDTIHLSADGNRLLAEQFARALLDENLGSVPATEPPDAACVG